MKKCKLLTSILLVGMLASMQIMIVSADTEGVILDNGVAEVTTTVANTTGVTIDATTVEFTTEDLGPLVLDGTEIFMLIEKDEGFEGYLAKVSLTDSTDDFDTTIVMPEALYLIEGDSSANLILDYNDENYTLNMGELKNDGSKATIFVNGIAVEGTWLTEDELLDPNDSVVVDAIANGEAKGIYAFVPNSEDLTIGDSNQGGIIITTSEGEVTTSVVSESDKGSGSSTTSTSKGSTTTTSTSTSTIKNGGTTTTSKGTTGSPSTSDGRSLVAVLSAMGLSVAACLGVSKSKKNE